MLADFYNESPTKTKTRCKIITTAIDIFAHSGMENVTMVEIADATNITIRNLYRYYANKDLLIVDTAYYALSNHSYDVNLHQDETGFMAVERFMNDLYQESYLTEKIIKFIIYFDLYIMNMDKKSEAYILYTTKYVKSINDLSKSTLHVTIQKGIDDGTLNIPQNEIGFYVEYIVQSLFSVYARVIMKEGENKAINKSLLKKQIEVILDHIRK